MRTNRRFSLPISALFMAFASTACTDSPDPVSVPRQASPPTRPSMVGIPTSTALRFINGDGQLDITDVSINLPEGGDIGGAPIVVTGKYELKSVPDCGGCKVTAYIGSELSAMPADASINYVLAESDGTDLPKSGTFKWTTRLINTHAFEVIGGGLIASSQFTPTTLGGSGLNIETQTPNWAFTFFEVYKPGVFPKVTGTVNAAGWYTSDVNVGWEVIFTHTVDNSTTGCDPVVLTADTGGQTIECKATSFLYSTTRSVTIRRDATKPVISNFVVTPVPNANGWRNGNANASWQCTDVTSKPVNLSGSQTLVADGANQSATATCVDNAGNTATQMVTGINIDKTAPTLSPSVSPDPIVQNGSATASPNATDPTSEIASASCDPVVTSQVGTFSVMCQATDKAGNTATKSVSYVVKSPYTFSGFLAPIVPGTLNSRTAGAAVPVQFKVGGNKGLTIVVAGSPSSKPLACPAGATITTTTQTATLNNGGGLQYDASTDTYTYLWKTDKAWAGTCRTFVLTLTDGIEHTADFQFKK